MESLLLYLKKTICGARKNVTAFLFMVNKPWWIRGKRCWDPHKQITMSQEIVLNSIISFSESGFSVWRWKKKITFYIHLNWKAAECGGWEPINSRSVTSFLFSSYLTYYAKPRYIRKAMKNYKESLFSKITDKNIMSFRSESTDVQSDGSAPWVHCVWRQQTGI